MKRPIIGVFVLLGLVLSFSACHREIDVNTRISKTADYGTLLVRGVRATASAIADAEASGMVSRVDAVKAMNTLLAITNKADDASRYMRIILDVQGTLQAAEAGTELQKTLDFMDTELFAVMVPLKNDTLKGNIAALLTEVSRTIGLINREILGRMK